MSTSSLGAARAIRLAVVPFVLAAVCASGEPQAMPVGIDRAQVPDWSDDDLTFFLHGSMSTEVVPERLLAAWIATYPELFPTPDMSHLGLIPNPATGLPLGVSRAEVPHLGGQGALGINCASWHLTEIRASADAAPVRILGSAADFDAEAFIGTVIQAMFSTMQPQNMLRFLPYYLRVSDPEAGAATHAALEAALEQQADAITAAIQRDPAAADGVAAGALHEIAASDLALDAESLKASRDLVPLVRALLELFRNMRTALHFPHEMPEALPPPSGPGRNDAFGLLSLGLFGVPLDYAPVKYGFLWNLEHRTWVHWDGNTSSPMIRNLLAALGLGAPLVDGKGVVDHGLIERHTALTEKILPPRYPWTVDQPVAERGEKHFDAHCASCHVGSESDERLYDPREIATDPVRSESITEQTVESLNQLFASIDISGFERPEKPTVRRTSRYWAADLAGVWARSPYLHNGSVRTMWELLAPPGARAKSFQRGSRVYDTDKLGFEDAGHYTVDASKPGSSNAGHDYGTALSDSEKRELIEFLKSL